MQYLHTMVRISDINESLNFYCNLLGMVETNRIENESGRFTLIFLAAPVDAPLAEDTKAPLLELTYNWPPEDDSAPLQLLGGRNFVHLAYRVDNIYDLCQKLMNADITINRPPHDGHMAFVQSPDEISIELLQAGDALPPQEPWASMENTGSW